MDDMYLGTGEWLSDTKRRPSGSSLNIESHERCIRSSEVFRNHSLVSEQVLSPDKPDRPALRILLRVLLKSS